MHILPGTVDSILVLMMYIIPTAQDSLSHIQVHMTTPIYASIHTSPPSALYRSLRSFYRRAGFAGAAVLAALVPRGLVLGGGLGLAGAPGRMRGPGVAGAPGRVRGPGVTGAPGRVRGPGVAGAPGRVRGPGVAGAVALTAGGGRVDGRERGWLTVGGAAVYFLERVRVNYKGHMGGEQPCNSLLQPF